MNFKLFFITESKHSQKALKLNSLLKLLPTEMQSSLEFFEIVQSLDGFDLKIEPIGVLNHAFMSLNPSSVPKYLTHYSIYKKVLEEEIDFCIIAEDEVDLSDLINLLLMNPDYPDWAEITNLSSSGIKSLNAYAITKDGAEHILELLSNTKWLNGIKKFRPSDYNLPETFLSKSLSLSVEGLQDFSLINCIVAPIEKLIHTMCEFMIIKSYHKINFIGKKEGYNTFYIKNDLNNITHADLNSLAEQKTKKHVIDCIFYINLDQDIEKMNRTELMLEQTGIPFERFSAIKPSLKDIESGGEYEELFSKSKILESRDYFGENFDYLDLKKYQLGTLGCYLSHYKLMQRILSMDIPMDFVIIIEDDCFLNTEALSAVDCTIKDLPEDWDILRSTWSAPSKLHQITYSHPLSNSYEISMQRDIFQNIKSIKLRHPSVCPIIHTFCGGTHFQAINVKSIPKILEYLDSEVLIPIDSLYNTARLNVYNKKMGICHNIFESSSISVSK